MEDDLRSQLLGSIEAGRLVVLCGAGLSMAPPSELPSALKLANACYDKYVLAADPQCDHRFRDDLEALAEHFVSLGTLETIFITTFVPWDSFARPSNPGHAALADLLLCHAINAALSTNYDILIERQAMDYGADIDCSLDGDEANSFSKRHSPLLKFHGCSRREKKKTIWAKSQLDDPVIKERIRKTEIWMASNLREKDLLIVGFWSDWSYLNEIIDNALQNVSPATITVVDLSETSQLEGKAPHLWKLSHTSGVAFRHVKASGADFLDELRNAFSQQYLAKILASGKTTFETRTGIKCNKTWLNPPALSSDELYTLRRDSEGVPPGMPAKRKTPDDVELLGFFHLLLRKAGAIQTDYGYVLNDFKIRVINGAGNLLGTKKKLFCIPPAINSDVNIVACIGAQDFPGLPDEIIEKGRPDDFIRPATTVNWVDFNNAIKILKL